MKTRATGGPLLTGAAIAALVVTAGLSRPVRAADGVGGEAAQPAGSSPAPGAGAGGLDAMADRALGAAETPWDGAARRFGGYKSATAPSRDAVMQFQTNSEIREVIARGGMRVKRGDVLVRARDAEVVAAVDAQRALAANDLEVQGADKQSELAAFKFRQIKSSGTYSPTEFEDARIQSEIAVVQAGQARKNLEQQQIKLKQLQGQYERYYLEAPFDGVIEEVMVEVGQGVTEQEKVLRIVNTEKLWLDPYADTGETIKLRLKEGSPAWVLIDYPEEPVVVRGRVVYVSPVADSVSQTRRVRVEIDNPDGWPAGTQARVRFTEPSGDWKGKIKGGGGQGISAAPNDGARDPLATRPDDHAFIASVLNPVFDPDAPSGFAHYRTVADHRIGDELLAARKEFRGMVCPGDSPVPQPSAFVSHVLKAAPDGPFFRYLRDSSWGCYTARYACREELQAWEAARARAFALRPGQLTFAAAPVEGPVK